MDIKNLSTGSNRSAYLYVISITIILVTIIAFTYVNLIRNEYLQRTTFHNRFQSRLVFKAIAGLSKAHVYLGQALLNKNTDPILDAESMIQSAHSDYKIYLSEKKLHDEIIELNNEKDFQKLEKLINDLIEQNDATKTSIELLQTDIFKVVDDLYFQEAGIWQTEALRYNEISKSKDQNRIFFYSMVVFFSIFEIGLIYFTRLRLKLLGKIQNQHEKLIISTRLSTLGEMSAELAHEINNPLMVINGRAKVMREHIKDSIVDPGFLSKNIDIIHRNGERIEKIVKAYKLLARTGTNDQFETISLDKLFIDLRDLTERRMNDAQIEFSISSFSPDLKIEAKLVQVLQVFTNLVANSIHAIAKLDERWIKIEVFETGTMIHFHFIDSGSGINKDHVPHLFDAFFTTKNSREGTGLGLSISAKLVRDHNGEIFYNQNNRHTEFIVKLPKIYKMPHS